MERDLTSCAKCERLFEKLDLSRCPICFKKVCEDCARKRGGKEFCSQYCAEFFFHYDEDPPPEGPR